MRSRSNATAVLAMANLHGIKVMFSVVGDVDHIMNCTSVGCDSEAVIKSRMPRLFQIVDAHRSSPALLSWYICDDCPCGGDAPSDAKRHALSLVYSLLKERDPYHITSGAGGCDYLVWCSFVKRVRRGEGALIKIKQQGSSSTDRRTVPQYC